MDELIIIIIISLLQYSFKNYYINISLFIVILCNIKYSLIYTEPFPTSKKHRGETPKRLFSKDSIYDMSLKIGGV